MLKVKKEKPDFFICQNNVYILVIRLLFIVKTKLAKAKKANNIKMIDSKPG